MSTKNEVAIVPEHIPAHVLNGNMAREMNADAAAGISVGFPPSIRIKNGKFRLVDGAGEETTVKTSELKDGESLDIVVLRAKPGLNKVWYSKPYDPNAEASAPDCMSLDGVKPDASIKDPQCANCASCPRNAWGSGRNQAGEATKGKACADNKILAVLYKGGVYQFKLPPASLKNWGVFVKNLSARDVPLGAVIVYASFDEDVDYSILKFRVGGFIPEAAVPKLMTYITSPEVEEIVNPANVPPTTPAITQEAPAKTEAPPATDEADIFGGAEVEEAVVEEKTDNPAKETTSPAVEAPTDEPDWASMTVKDLKTMAKDLGMKGYSKLSADELSDAVYEAWDASTADAVAAEPAEGKVVDVSPEPEKKADSGVPSDQDLADSLGL